jgi:pimeloyl-ACP methyl ester carboxylesterase
MPEFREERVDVNGIDTAVFTAGAGEPLVFLHGAGTAAGFDRLLPLAERFRLIVPHHPGFGASADDPSVDGIHDYALHYLDLFDQLGLEELSLVGHSLGGYLAATLAIEQTRRVRRLVLGAPFGLRVREHPTVDFFSIPDEEVPSYLAADLSIFAGLPSPPPPEFFAERYREATSFARIAWHRPYDLKLAKWLHRIAVPTLIVWGDRDRLIPVGQAAVWAGHIPAAKITILPGVGHLLFNESHAAVAAIADFAGVEQAGVEQAVLS